MLKKLLYILLIVNLTASVFAQKKLTPLIDGYAAWIAPPPSSTEMVFIPAGPFLMGSSDSHINDVQYNWGENRYFSYSWFDDEAPQHTNDLPAYYIDRFEVTNRQYRQFIEATNHKTPAFWNDPSLNGDEQPVVGVNWADADAFCWWAKKRLPKEAEWEKAARGVSGRIFPWGDKWIPENVNSKENGLNKTVPVGSYPWGKSTYGVMDMAGNAWEWCSDWYDRYTYRFPPERRRPRYSSQGYRVIRGGSFLEPAFELRSSYRFRFKQQYNFVSIGFRCAKTP